MPFCLMSDDEGLTIPKDVLQCLLKLIGRSGIHVKDVEALRAPLPQVLGALTSCICKRTSCEHPETLRESHP